MTLDFEDNPATSETIFLCIALGIIPRAVQRSYCLLLCKAGILKIDKYIWSL